MNEYKKYFKISETMLKPILIGLCFILFGFAMLQLGINIGSSRGRFACNWAKNYQDNFGGPKGGFDRDFRFKPMNDFQNSHGIFGEIIKIEEDSIIINSREGSEKIININDSAIIKNLEKNSNSKELKLGDKIMIIGVPNEKGQIEAKLIRVLSKPFSFNAKPYKYE